MKGEWILTGGGPESEGGAGRAFPGKISEQREGHGKAGVKSKQFGLGGEQDPTPKVAAGKAGQGMEVVQQRPWKTSQGAAVEFRGPSGAGC